tara:strand:- start:2260 stop:3603 length:1344 start_codon:yes stop_codon:yes gene_type:complete
MKHIVLHIGTGKTGTSTIQNALHHNRRLLRRRHNVDYAELDLLVIEHFGERIAAHYQLIERLRHADDKGLAAITDYIAACAQDTIIFSCENLYHHLGEAEIQRLAELLQPHRVSIVCYVRRQDLYVESAYRQQVKVGVAKVSVRKFLARHMSAKSLNEVHANYYRMLRHWDQHFGTGNVVVRLFDTNRFAGGDLLTDFLQAAGIGNVDLDRPGEGVANQAVPAELISVLRTFNEAGVVAKEQHQKFVQDLRDNFDFRDYPLINDTVRAKILDNYAESNRLLFAHYGIEGTWSEPELTSARDNIANEAQRSDTELLSALYYQAWMKQHSMPTSQTLMRRGYYLLNDCLFYFQAMRRQFGSEALIPRADYLRLLRTMIARREFSPTFYLRFNADIAAAGLDPLLHYLQYGLREVRIPHPAISETEAKRIAHSVASGSHPYLNGWPQASG